MDKERLFRYLDRKYSSKSEIIPNIPLGENADAIWAEILQNRRERGIELPLVNVHGDTYWYILTNKMISASEVIVDELMEQENTAELHRSSVATIEEIFYTGFMEGAQISVQDAMEFLQSGEEPESVEELILMNSRQAAGFASENMYHAIDSNYLHNLAYFLTDGLDNGGGDYRITDTVEIPSLQGEVVQLPPAAMIPEQTDRFAEFLADTATHPLIIIFTQHKRFRIRLCRKRESECTRDLAVICHDGFRGVPVDIRAEYGNLTSDKLLEVADLAGLDIAFGENVYACGLVVDFYISARFHHLVELMSSGFYSYTSHLKVNDHIPLFDEGVVQVAAVHSSIGGGADCAGRR